MGPSNSNLSLSCVPENTPRPLFKWGQRRIDFPCRAQTQQGMNSVGRNHRNWFPGCDCVCNHDLKEMWLSQVSVWGPCTSAPFITCTSAHTHSDTAIAQTLTLAAFLQADRVTCLSHALTRVQLPFRLCFSAQVYLQPSLSFISPSFPPHRSRCKRSTELKQAK